MLARRRFLPGDRRGGHNLLALRKIHQELSGDRLQQLAFVAEGDTMLRRSPRSSFEQRILDTGCLFSHRIKRLANHSRTHTHCAEVSNLLEFQQLGERVRLRGRDEASPLPVRQLARSDMQNSE